MTSCSAQSWAAGEPLAGTAPVSQQWLFIEQEGAYRGREAALSSGLPLERGRELLAACDAESTKLVLVRAVGRHPAASQATRRVWLLQAAFGATRCWTWQQGPDLDGLAALRPPVHAIRIARPTLMVCTHARRDVCCALLGRPLAAAAMAAGIDTWEASHIGGHRFAPVVLDVASGYAYGRLSPEDVRNLGPAASIGKVRGHVGLSPAQQMADIAVRQRFGVTPTSLRSVGEVIVVVDSHGREYRVEVAESDLAAAAESCGKPPTTRSALAATVTDWPTHRSGEFRQG